MSLLMKALEKAAKDRGDANGEAAVPTHAVEPNAGIKSNSELTLEPVIARPAEPVPAQRATLGPQREHTTARPSTIPSGSRDSLEAAAMIRAAGQAEPSGNVIAYLRDRPLITFGTVAALFLVGFGGYVYMQMNPGMFVAQAPRPAPVAPIAQAPATSLPGGSVGPALIAPPPPLSLTSLLPPTEQVAGKENLSAPAPVVAAAATSAPFAASAAVPIVASRSTPRDTIKVTAGAAPSSVNPVLSEAYNALAVGNLETSQRLYNQLLKSDARNVEALLGLAAIATQQGDRDTSTRHYIKVIEVDPRNSLAQAGLIGIIGSADPQSAETRVKQLISRDASSGYLYFTLGNTYVDQMRWPDAQQAFFQAHHLQPDNPDYAYNLAIALEHIGQAKTALEFYRRAVILAAAKGHANFSPDAAQGRVDKLEKVVQ